MIINFTIVASLFEFKAMNPRGEVTGQTHFISSLLLFVINPSGTFLLCGVIEDE